jgi:hypothetical protein
MLKTYVIEREIPGLGKLNQAQLKDISSASGKVLNELGPSIEWIDSYVTGNKMYCIYKAENPEIIREHAKKGGFPADSIVEVGAIINGETANQ